MKFKDYVANVNKMLVDNPEYAEFETVASADDEGNSYEGIYFEPSVGHYDEENEEWKSLDLIKEDGDIDPEDFPLNAICVN